MPATASLRLSTSRAASICALALMVIGVLALFGRLLAFEPWADWLPGSAPMKSNAALCCLMAGAGLWWRDRPRIRSLLGLLTVSLSGLALFEAAVTLDFGVEQLFPTDPSALPELFSGRMSPLAALSFVFTGLVLTLLRVRKAAVQLAGEAIVLWVAAVQFVALLGHATGVRFLYSLEGFGSLTLLTAATLEILSIGLLIALKETQASLPASDRSPTGQRLQWGFGLITALLLALGVFSATRLNTIETSIITLSTEARSRLNATYELKINVLDYGLDVRVFLADDTGSRERAKRAAVGVVLYLDAYAQLARTPQQQNYAKQMQVHWQEIYQAGQALMQAANAAPDQLAALALKRQNLEDFLDQQVQPDATITLSRTETDIADDLQSTQALTLALLVAAFSAALITSSVVRLGVLAAERELRDREERLRLATAAADLRIWAWRTDLDQITWDNDMPGSRFGSAFGSQPLSISRLKTALIHPDDRQTFSKAIDDALGTQERVIWQGRMHGADGTLRWIELTGQAESPLAGKAPRRVIGTLRDITARQKAAEALRQSEQRFRALFDNGPIAIYSCDLAGTIIEFNHAAAALWRRTPKLGESCESFAAQFRFFELDGSALPGLPPGPNRLSNSTTGALPDSEFLVERPDGSRITVVSRAVLLTDPHGEQTGSMTCCYETTERSRLELQTQAHARALAELHSRKDEFLAMLGHELRNPLAALANAVQLLRMNQHADASLDQGRNIIERQVRQLKHLVDDLLEVSRITTGSVRLRQQQVSLRSVAERAVETVQPLMAEQRHTLSVNFPDEPIYVNADGARLEQVLVNLLSNAAKYTEKGGRIALVLEEEGVNAAIRVRDNGIGIAPELLPHIFELFTQAERSLDRSQGGLGIGLSLVQRLVELHGGNVVAHSELGHGSEFVVRMPLMRQAVPTAPAPLTEIATSQSGGLRVMVVDDNADAAESLAVLLEMTGHTVRLAYDGPSALQAVITHRPHVVLLDIGLPGLDGFEVAQRIRARLALDGVTLVALTGYGQDSDRQRALDVGFDYHLVKPADFGEIEKILATVSEKCAGQFATP
jgi:signal transduction histidine kinase/ActR/RegA family two-component response regulator